MFQLLAGKLAGDGLLNDTLQFLIMPLKLVLTVFFVGDSNLLKLIYLLAESGVLLLQISVLNEEASLSLFRLRPFGEELCLLDCARCNLLEQKFPVHP